MTGRGGGGNMMGMSDRRAKQNIVRVATLPQGIGLYLFDYRPELRDLAGHGRQLGVMADEVEQIKPEAVSLHPTGYKMVDYGQLDINPVDVATSLPQPTNPCRCESGFIRTNHPPPVGANSFGVAGGQAA